jgi:hypothetical protein
MKAAIKAEEKIAVVETIQDPAIPINRPKKKQDIKLRKGNSIIHKYIESTKKVVLQRFQYDTEKRDYN